MKYRILVLTGLLVATASIVCAQGLRYESYYNWNFMGSGARARAMGGAFLAVSDDGNAGTWNPAGLPYNEGVLTSMNLNFVHSSVENNPVGYGEASDNFGSIGSWTFVAPAIIREHEFIGSVSYNRVQDIFYEDGIIADYNLVFEEFSTHQTLQTIRHSAGNLALISLAVGTEITSNLSLGASVALASGDRQDRDLYLSLSDPYELQGKTFVDTVINRNVAEVDYAGVSPKLGAMYRTDKWSFAAVYSLPWTLTQELDYSNLQQVISRGIYQDPLEALFVTERRIEMPRSIGLGTSYRATENLLLAVDYQFRNFKDQNIRTQQTRTPQEGEHEGITNPASQFTDFPLKWYNLHQVRLGAEYVMETDYGRVPLRLGLHNQPSVVGDASGTTNRLIRYYNIPVNDIMVTPGGSNEQNMGFGFSFGGGIHWTQIHLDFAFELTSMSSEDQGNYEMVWSNNGRDFHTTPLTTYSREYKTTASRFLLNFTGYF